MEAGNQQRILGYFIEEAKEHLDTLEKGLLDLRGVVTDPERVNEMFRAAHSVKGGAAMLGFASIQKTAHRLEDAFKILKEQPIKVDHKLETLFLQGYDILKDLIEQLQGPFGLREEEAEKKVQAAEPEFAQLQSYLNQLASGTGEAPASDGKKPESLSRNFGVQVTEILRQMLQLFKQQDTPTSRQQLQEHCKHLVKLGAGSKQWKEVIQLSYKAIANPQNSYPTLARAVIPELKQASDRLQHGKGSDIALSPTLRQLAATPTATATKKEKPPAATKPSDATKQITLPIEPKAAARAIIQAFDKPQLVQLVKLLTQAARKSP
ncbi:MAG TPA: Hpt domain-containing protein [Coleofasciculaceae cyanobacterium]